MVFFLDTKGSLKEKFKSSAAEIKYRIEILSSLSQSKIQFLPINWDFVQDGSMIVNELCEKSSLIKTVPIDYIREISIAENIE